MAKTYKGFFRPTHPEKYAGDPKNIIYRSGWERRFMLYCDRNNDITNWASEEIAVPYYNPVDKRVHKYFPDFIIKTKHGKKFMIEIKPLKFTKPPATPKRKTKKFLNESFEYIKNVAKWEAAKKFCEDNNMEFKVFTEKELGL